MSVHPRSHPSEQTLNLYGSGKLDDRSVGAVDAHLEKCPECWKRLAEMSADSFLGRLRGAQAQGVPDLDEPHISSSGGLSILAAGNLGKPAPPPPGSLPLGIAGHPDYQILRELGHGGMGVVYLAQNTLLDRMEVLKVVGSHLVGRSGVLDRFLGEIRNAARLNHPNVVTAYSAMRIGESVVLAMEYVDGLDLAKLVKTRGPLPVATPATLFIRLRWACSTRTRMAWSIVTSSQPTSSSQRSPGDRLSRCSTSDWPRSPARDRRMAA